MNKLPNGTYIANVKMYPETKRRVIIFNGKASIYTLQGVFVANAGPDELNDFLNNFTKTNRANTLFNVGWMIGGQIKEIVVQNASYAVCKHKQNFLKRTIAYREGLLMIIPSNLS